MNRLNPRGQGAIGSTRHTTATTLIATHQRRRSNIRRAVADRRRSGGGLAYAYKTVSRTDHIGSGQLTILWAARAHFDA